MAKDKAKAPREDGISLAPLSFDEALSGLLRVKPPKKAAAKKPKAKAKKPARKKKP